MSDAFGVSSDPSQLIVFTTGGKSLEVMLQANTKLARWKRI